MVAGLYSSLQGIAAGLLSSYGQPVTLRRRQKTYLPESGLNSETVTDYAAQGVVAPFKDSRIDGSLIKAGDLQVTIAAQGLAVVPDATQDCVLVGAVEYRLVRVSQTNPAGLPVIYELQVRSGP